MNSERYEVRALPCLPTCKPFALTRHPSMASTEGQSASAPIPSSDTRTFDKWRKTFGLITGLGISEAERQQEMEAYHGRTCEQWKRQLMQNSQY